jgi:serine/threonine protein kinase
VDAPESIGPYRIERLLGAGSFATVWLGYDPSLDARVAIKVLADNWSHDLRVRERFRDEGRLLWRLDHDRVVRVHGLGDLPDGRPYLVMAWADGGSLRDRLDAGPIAVDAALRLLREIAAGVAVLHREGIVHRDLSPGNVLFRTGEAEEQVLIADLGLAKAVAAASGLTARAGTPGYMAPEQDDPLAVVDTRTDVYGLGRLGQRLLSVDDRLRPGVPLLVGDVLRTATRKRPDDRQRDASAFAAALDRALASRGWGTRRRRRATVAGLAALTVALVAALAAYAIVGREPAGAPDRVAGPTPPTAPGPSVSVPVAPTAPVATTAPPAVDPAPPPLTRGSTSPAPTGDPTPTTSACLGPVQYEVDVPETELELLESMCFTAGGVLRLRNIGPGLVTAEPESLVDYNYEAAVVDLRFLSPGTVTVTVPKDERTHTITVVVIR